MKYYWLSSTTRIILVKFVCSVGFISIIQSEFLVGAISTRRFLCVKKGETEAGESVQCKKKKKKKKKKNSVCGQFRSAYCK